MPLLVWRPGRVALHKAQASPTSTQVQKQPLTPLGPGFVSLAFTARSEGSWA